MGVQNDVSDSGTVIFCLFNVSKSVKVSFLPSCRSMHAGLPWTSSKRAANSRVEDMFRLKLGPPDLGVHPFSRRCKRPCLKTQGSIRSRIPASFEPPALWRVAYRPLRECAMSLARYIECKPMDREVTDDMQMTTLLVSDELYSV